MQGLNGIKSLNQSFCQGLQEYKGDKTSQIANLAIQVPNDLMIQVLDTLL